MIAVATRLPTAFTEALRAVVARVPGARAAIFLDSEGESVDEFSESPITGVRLTGAHLGVVLGLARERCRSAGMPEEIIVETERAVILARNIDERYLVVLEADADASIGLMRRELATTSAALRAQM